jgi:hypothetical protein
VQHDARPHRSRRHAGEALAIELTGRGVLAFPRPGRGYLRGYLSLAHTDADLVATGDAVTAALRAAAPHFAAAAARGTVGGS